MEVTVPHNGCVYCPNSTVLVPEVYPDIGNGNRAGIGCNVAEGRIDQAFSESCTFVVTG